MSIRLELKAKLTTSLIDAAWHYLIIGPEIGEQFPKRSGSRRVICTLNGIETFQCALMPMKSDFMILINKPRRMKLGIGAGDEVSVVLEEDSTQYGMPMPEEFQEVLDQDPEGSELFHSLTAGKQRSILYYVGKIKDIDRRIHNSLIMLEHLKRNGGKILADVLKEELKRPII